MISLAAANCKVARSFQTMIKKQHKVMEDKGESDKTHLFLAALCFLLGWLMSLSNPPITGLAVYGNRKVKKHGI